MFEIFQDYLRLNGKCSFSCLPFKSKIRNGEGIQIESNLKEKISQLKIRFDSILDNSQQVLDNLKNDVFIVKDQSNNQIDSFFLPECSRQSVQVFTNSKLVYAHDSDFPLHHYTELNKCAQSLAQPLQTIRLLSQVKSIFKRTDDSPLLWSLLDVLTHSSVHKMMKSVCRSFASIEWKSCLLSEYFLLKELMNQVIKETKIDLGCELSELSEIVQTISANDNCLVGSKQSTLFKRVSKRRFFNGPIGK